MDLAGLRKYIHLGSRGVVPPDPLKNGKDLTGAPNIHLVMLGKFKGENNVKIIWWQFLVNACLELT